MYHTSCSTTEGAVTKRCHPIWGHLAAESSPGGGDLAGLMLLNRLR